MASLAHFLFGLIGAGLPEGAEQRADRDALPLHPVARHGRPRVRSAAAQLHP